MQLPFSSPSSCPDSIPLGSPPNLRAEPSWRDYFLDLNCGNRIAPGARRAYFLNAAQIGQFAAPLPAGLEFFAGRHIRFGITTRVDLSASYAERLASLLASGGVKFPGVSKRVRAVCSSGFVFFVIEGAVGREPTLPGDLDDELRSGGRPAALAAMDWPAATCIRAARVDRARQRPGPVARQSRLVPLRAPGVRLEAD